MERHGPRGGDMSLKPFGGECFEMHRCQDAKRHGLLRFELFKKIDKFLSLNFRNILISPLDGEKKFLGELNELRNFREGYDLKNNSCLVQHKTVLEPSSAFVMLTGVRKRLLPLTKREGCDSVISSGFKSKISITNENNLSCKDLSYFGRSALLCRQGRELSALVPQYLSNFSDTVFSRFTSHFSRKRIAFTLAEVLITLGIIGFVAAMTLPILIQNHQKRVAVERLKKEYSLLQQALKMYQADNNVDFDEFDTTLSADEFMQTYILPYVQTIGECENSTKCYKKFPFGHNKITPLVINNKFYILKDGSFLGISQDAPVGKVFFIDINGEQKPNITGRDIFFFFFVNKSTILKTDYISCNGTVQSLNSGLYLGSYAQCYMPFAKMSRDQILGKVGKVDRACSEDRGATPTGDGCAALIMLDGWQIAKDYPW